METKNKSSKIILTLILSLFVVTIVIGGYIINKSNNTAKQLSAEKANLEIAVQERDSIVNEFIASLDTIESSLTFINEKRGQLVLKSSELTVSQKDAIIRDIKLMNTMLVESSKSMEEWEAKLKKSGIQLRSFKNKIAKLNKSIEQQNNQIALLNSQFNQKTEQLTVVTFENDRLQNEVLSYRDTVQVKNDIIEQKDEIINNQIGEINKAYFAYGTSKELVNNGVVAKEGGFLGIGSNMGLIDNFNEDYFTKIDIVEQHSFELNAKKVHLISEHPSGSYKLIEEDGLITKLEIETPAEFWKVSQYAVIEVKL
jgi:hypothetical protein